MSTAAGSWLSATEISAVLAVSPSTLELYALRGTLPSHVDGLGRRLFDVAAAGAIFRRRTAHAPAAQRGSFGRLGEIALGGGTPHRLASG